MRPHFCESPFYREKVASLTESLPFEFGRPHFRTLSTFPTFSAEMSVQILFEIGFQHFKFWRIISIFRDENWFSKFETEIFENVWIFSDNFDYFNIFSMGTLYKIKVFLEKFKKVGKFWKCWFHILKINFRHEKIICFGLDFFPDKVWLCTIQKWPLPL